MSASRWQLDLSHYNMPLPACMAVLRALACVPGGYSLIVRAQQLQDDMLAMLQSAQLHRLVVSVNDLEAQNSLAYAHAALTSLRPLNLSSTVTGGDAPIAAALLWPHGGLHGAADCGRSATFVPPVAEACAEPLFSLPQPAKLQHLSVHSTKTWSIFDYRDSDASHDALAKAVQRFQHMQSLRLVQQIWHCCAELDMQQLVSIDISRCSLPREHSAGNFTSILQTFAAPPRREPHMAGLRHHVNGTPGGRRALLETVDRAQLRTQQEPRLARSRNWGLHVECSSGAADTPASPRHVKHRRSRLPYDRVCWCAGMGCSHGNNIQALDAEHLGPCAGCAATADSAHLKEHDRRARAAVSCQPVSCQLVSSTMALRQSLLQRTSQIFRPRQESVTWLGCPCATVAGASGLKSFVG